MYLGRVGPNAVSPNPLAVTGGDVGKCHCFECQAAAVARDQFLLCQGCLLNQALHDELVALLLSFRKDLVGVG
jgi:hypothetical protein